MRFEIFEQILKLKYYRELLSFIRGQTVDNHGIYFDDFLKWFHQLEVID